MLRLRMNKRGQVAEWMVATVIIILLTVVFIYVSGLMATLNAGFNKITDKDSGLIEQQMLFAILKMKFGEKSVLEIVESGNVAEAKAALNGILKAASEKGLKCSFFLGSDVVSFGGEGKRVEMKLNSGKLVALQC